jgi:hypothetical protein
VFLHALRWKKTSWLIQWRIQWRIEWRIALLAAINFALPELVVSKTSSDHPRQQVDIFVRCRWALRTGIADC